MIQDFIDNPTIRRLAKKPFWTINVDGKKPLDIEEYEKTGYIRGAKSENCLTDLDNLLRILNAVPKQFTYSLNAARDNIVILDIEKTCPDNIKEKLLKLPFIYGDISMSGLGYHLVFPCPALDEITINKTVMKEEHGYFEILINHFVTFTNYTLFPQYDTSNAPVQFQEIWNELRAEQRNVVKKEYDVDIESVNLDFPEYNTIKSAVIRHFRQRFTKTPADFSNDLSRYEFAVIGSIRYSLNMILEVPIFAKRVQLDEIQKIVMVYNIVTEVVKYRSKHDEIRDGKPMLLYRVFNSFATTYKDDTKAE